MAEPAITKPRRVAGGLTVDQLRIVAPERLAIRARPRVPEPMVMDDAAAASEFDWAGTSVLTPAYAACARAMSPLVPQGGTVLDLGSGSGRFLAFLARQRPDISIVGVELSEPMLALAERTLASEGVSERVSVVRGDMTDVLHLMPPRVDLVSSVYALHHLPSDKALSRCLSQMAALSDRASVFIFDLARLRSPRTWERILRMGPDLPDLFWRDSVASERAAWSFEEIRRAAEDAGLGGLQALRQPVLRTWQMHGSRLAS